MKQFKSIINNLFALPTNEECKSVSRDSSRSSTNADTRLKKSELLASLVCGSSGNTPHGEIINSDNAVPERCTFATTGRHQDYEPLDNITFRATSIRESYTLHDINKGLHQVMTGESLGMDQSFVDFVLGGFVEDELELYQNKKRIAMPAQSA